MDENLPETAIANLVNDILLSHKKAYIFDGQTQDGIDEVQDMVSAAFVKGIDWERKRGEQV